MAVLIETRGGGTGCGRRGKKGEEKENACLGRQEYVSS
jgi:hypothetical protein